MMRIINAIDVGWSGVSLLVVGGVFSSFARWAAFEYPGIQSRVVNEITYTRTYAALSSDGGITELPTAGGLSTPPFRLVIPGEGDVAPGGYEYVLVNEYVDGSGELNKVVVPLFHVQIQDLPEIEAGKPSEE